MTCPICVIAHDPAIHTATLNVRKYLRQRVKGYGKPFKAGQRRTEKKNVDLVLNFANGTVTRRFPTRSTGDGTNKESVWS